MPTPSQLNHVLAKLPLLVIQQGNTAVSRLSAVVAKRKVVYVARDDPNPLQQVFFFLAIKNERSSERRMFVVRIITQDTRIVSYGYSKYHNNRRKYKHYLIFIFIHQRSLQISPLLYRSRRNKNDERKKRTQEEAV